MTNHTTCKGPDCDRPLSRTGYCSTHYRQHRSGQPLTTIRLRKDKSTAKPCRVDGCARPTSYVRETLCAAHAHQFKAGKQFTPVKESSGWYAPGTLCSFDGCANRVSARGLCLRHYNQTRGLGLRPLGPEKVKAHARDEGGNKQCAKCRLWLPESGFAKSSGRGDGLQAVCRGCKAAHYRVNADKVRDKMRESRFGITREQFDAMLNAQGNVCAICKSDKPGTNYWSVDHDHACCPGSDKTCGKCIRGILCSHCNHGLGNVRDSIETLNSMIAYLQEGRALIPEATRHA